MSVVRGCPEVAGANPLGYGGAPPHLRVPRLRASVPSRCGSKDAARPICDSAQPRSDLSTPRLEPYTPVFRTSCGAVLLSFPLGPSCLSLRVCFCAWSLFLLHRSRETCIVILQTTSPQPPPFGRISLRVPRSLCDCQFSTPGTRCPRPRDNSAHMAPAKQEKKGSLTLEKLASYDDVITDALVDKVG